MSLDECLQYDAENNVVYANFEAISIETEEAAEKLADYRLPHRGVPSGEVLRDLQIMLQAPFRLVGTALPETYEKGWGCVINVSSVHGLIASSYKSAYVSAKHGLEGLWKVVALGGGPKGVTSNCTNPAYMRTPPVNKQIADQAGARGVSESEVIEKIMRTETAIKRLVEPEEVAELAAFLCVPEASLINDASPAMYGGWMAR